MLYWIYYINIGPITDLLDYYTVLVLCISINFIIIVLLFCSINSHLFDWQKM